MMEYIKIKKAFNLVRELLFLALLTPMLLVAMYFVGHKGPPQILASLLVFFSASKIYILLSRTFKRMDSLSIKESSFNQMLFVLGIIISIIILSFSVDFLCVSKIYENAFYGISSDTPVYIQWFNLFYLSVVTFTTVGYGDISPTNPTARIIAIFEMLTSFLVVAFVISKYFRTTRKDNLKNHG